MDKPKLLDLFCGAGIGADGYDMAGFDITGVDAKPQPNYPYKFIQADAMYTLNSMMPENFDVIRASPPCQLFTRAAKLRDAQGGVSKESEDLLTPTIELLRERWNHIPWIVENVEDAKSLMPGYIKLCGSMFNLGVQRHRLFLSNITLTQPKCNHSSFPLDPISNKPRPWGVYHVPADSIPFGGRTARNIEHGLEVMGVSRKVPWESLKEGIPPSYCEHLGKEFLKNLIQTA